MLFLESWFWIFAAIVIPVFWLCPRALKAILLLAASGVFQFHFAGPAGAAPVAALGAFTFGVGLAIESGRRRWLFHAAWLLLVAALGFYKYADFLVANAASLLSVLRLELPARLANWKQPAAPLGISFFTFEFIHYLYEVRVRGRQAIRNPIHFALFAIFFPCLAAGPIKRFPDFVPQLSNLQNPGRAVVWTGGQRIIRGLFKKVCIADLLVECIRILDALPEYTGPIVVAIAVLQGFRIYYDFSGYTDIALGLAQLMNLRLPENFDRPYFSSSLQEFWRRWHMSLSSWIRDYVYIPLGGNRAHRAFNLLAAMFLCGLWHGAAWNFAVWGLYHGGGLVAEAGIRRLWPGLFTENRTARFAGWLVCYAYVTYGWLLFFYPIETVFRMTKGLLRWGAG